jgi:xanthine dehydrogenase YagR molybdenum-binding subunit
MSLLRTVVETAARYMPDRAPDPLMHTSGHIGAPYSRVDGSLKVTGKARFTAEFAVEGLTHAAVVCSTIAKGRATTIDTAAAQAAPGVVGVITHTNAPRMKPPSLLNVERPRAFAASDLPILQDNRVHWNGQPVAVVVAETLEQAEHAASLVRVEYEPEPAHVSFDELKSTAASPSDILGEPAELTIGDAGASLAAAEVTVDGVYRTPWYHHNALEPHATTAAWNDDGTLIVFESTQTVSGNKYSLADVFALKPDAVQVVALFVGGGFGGKAGLWQNTVLCVAAAKVTRRAVRLALSRKDVFRVIGGRTIAEQRVALGARTDGHLTALIHTGTTATTTHARYAEQCTFPPRHLYASDSIHVGQTVVNLDTIANTWMRAPGESIGTFALESAIDELADTLKIDPIELRRINEPATDPTRDVEFSSRNLIEAYRLGAEQFGWHRRSPEPRSQRDGRWLIGQGVATAYYPVYRFPAKARLRLSADGTAVVQAAANEMGMGTATVQIQHAAERLGLPIDKVSFQYGDSTLPDSPMAGGSCQTVSIAASVHAAIEKAHRELLRLARDASDSPLAGAKYHQTVLRDGRLFRRDRTASGETYSAILQRAGQESIDVEASAPFPLEMMKYSMASYGAQFCEARVNEDSGEVRLSRWLGSFDCGRVVNPKTTASQLRGGIVMGIGMALTEETLLDPRSGRIVNPSLAEYHVPVNLDVPPIEILWTDIPDEHTPMGARGVGELGITGVAAAVANAIFNATGTRVRDLPITLDKLLSR